MRKEEEREEERVDAHLLLTESLNGDGHIERLAKRKRAGRGGEGAGGRVRVLFRGRA